MKNIQGRSAKEVRSVEELSKYLSYKYSLVSTRNIRNPRPDGSFEETTIYTIVEPFKEEDFLD